MSCTCLYPVSPNRKNPEQALVVSLAKVLPFSRSCMHSPGGSTQLRVQYSYRRHGLSLQPVCVCNRSVNTLKTARHNIVNTSEKTAMAETTDC